MSLNARNEARNWFLDSGKCKEKRFEDCSGNWKLRIERKDNGKWVDTVSVSFGM